MSEICLPYEGHILLTSGYGYRTLNGAADWHPGLDLVGQDDKTIRAAGDGTVVYSTIVTNRSDRTWEWGNFVCIKTGWHYVYTCHMARRFVKAGDTVKAGQPIGVEGNTGYSFGAHCHFEVRGGDGVAVDPFPILGLPQTQNKSGAIFYNTFNKEPDEPGDPMEEDMTGEEIYKRLIKYLSSLPESAWSQNEGGMAAAENTIGSNGKPIIDGTNPRCFITREQLAAILLRLGITG